MRPISIYEKKESKQRGAVAVEFLLVMPTFIFLCMLILELSLSLVDRHFMKLAAFEAARSYLTEPVENPCADGLTDIEKEKASKIRTRAKRAAVLKMAAVSPSIISFLAGFGIDAKSAELGDFTTSGGPFTKAIAHLMVRIPTAWALTHVKCSYSSVDDSVTVDLTYLRAPEMPFVKHALWAVWVINEMNNALTEGGLSELMRFDLGQHYFGVYGSSPALETMKTKFGELKTKVKGTLATASSLNENLQDASKALNAIPGFKQSFGTYFDTASASFNKVITDSDRVMSGGLDSIEDFMNSGSDPIQKAIDAQSTLITGIVYSVPESLRLIPMKSHVRLARPKVARAGEDVWQDARAFIVAPFTGDAAGPVWSGWAKGMVTQSGEIKAEGE